MYEEDEGFVLNEIEVTSKKTSMELKFQLENGLALIESKKPNDFLPRQTSYLKYSLKQQSPLVTRAAVLPYQPDQEALKKGSSTKTRDRKQALHEKYLSGNAYRLAYCRYASDALPEAAQLASNFASNYIYLGQAFDYNPNEYPQLLPPDTPSGATLLGEYSQELLFDSNFQCGNLLFAFQDSEQPLEYHLVLHNDTNSRGYTQWFYFSVDNHLGRTARFRIVNLIKRSSLFSEGMKPWVLYSEGSEAGCWRTAGSNISYDRTRLQREADTTKSYYQLVFDIDFRADGGKAYVAMCPPYSYSKLIAQLKQFQLEAAASSHTDMKLEVVAHSISSNCLPLVTISQRSQEEPKAKSLIGFTARQHPGQTWSSYLMDGILKFLLSDSPFAAHLKERFDFVLFPMINVDGVIYGNFRCDINGNDMNRRWRQPHKIFQSAIVQLRRKLQYLQLDRTFEWFFDLHGHSKKLNTFCYSCIQDEVTCRILPLILDKLDPGFYFPDCTFNLDQSKMTTARAILFELIKKESVMTIECSFFCTNKQGNLVGFSQQYMNQFAENIIKALFIYYSGEEVKQVDRKKIEDYARREITLLQAYQRNHAQDSGSDSDPFQFQLTSDQRNENVMPKKQQMSSIPLANKRTSKIKPIKFKKLQQALSEKNHQPRNNEESKQLQSSPVHRRPRRETEHNKTRPEQFREKLDEISPRKYNRKVVSEVKEFCDKPTDPPEKDTKLFEDTQSRQFQPFGSDILIKEENKEFMSCNLPQTVQRPLYHIAREFNRLNMAEKKGRFSNKPIHDNSSLDNFDAKFSDYLLRKNNNNARMKDAIERREDRDRYRENLTMEEIVTGDKYPDKEEQQEPEGIRPLALLSQKFKEELEIRKRRETNSQTRRRILPLAASTNSEKPLVANKGMAESLKIGGARQKPRDSYLGEFSRIWKLNMKRYGKDMY